MRLGIAMPTGGDSRLPDLLAANLAHLGGLGPGVLAVSGGPDSVAMLRGLASLPDSGRFVVAHLNHQLRGTESDEDAEFVRKLCPALSHVLATEDVAKIARDTGQNLEAAARRVRYAFLTSVARDCGAKWVATGHTLDDQAETVLHRLIRGSGLNELRGIAPSRELAPGIRLLRPMLTLRREELREYLNSIGQGWREDSSNLDPRMTRNRIRHELLPILRSFNPAIDRTLAGLAEQAERRHQADRQRFQLIADQMERPRAGQVIVLDGSRLQSLDDWSSCEVLRYIWQRENWPRDGMTREHWRRASGILRGEGTAWDLPDGMRIESKGPLVLVGPRAAFTSPAGS